MAKTLLIFNKKQYDKLEEQLQMEGKEIVTITYYLENSKIEDITDNTVMDISSLAGLFETNSGIQFQFEQLFTFFPDKYAFYSR